jgi:hypothetical protein
MLPTGQKWGETMGITHAVVAGECLSSIAAAHGFADYRTVYDDAGNVDLRRLRPNPNIIYPGDVVHIPDKEPKAIPCSTGATHRFRLKTRRDLLKIVVQDSLGEALANKPYVLIIDAERIRGRTSAIGLVSTHVPLHSASAILQVWMNDEDAGNPDLGRDFVLSIGGLDPVLETTGVQARLNNLGYPCGPVDGVHGDATAAAVREFQVDNGLPATGELDGATRSKLEELHDDA